MLNVEEIEKFIDEDRMSNRKRLAKQGQEYYEGNHDILRARMFYYNSEGKLVEDKHRANIKIPHPFFTELSDQLSSFLTSFKEDNPIRAKETVEGLQEHLDTYFDDEFYSELESLVSGAYNKGFEYIYAYVNEDNRTAFQCADSLGVVEVRANETDDKCEYIIYYYVDRIGKEGKEIKRIQVWSGTEVSYYVQSGNGKIEVDSSVEINPRPHTVYTDENSKGKMGYSYGFIPFFRLDNNAKQISGLKPVKALIDDYDIHACSLSNNLKDFDTPLHVVKGYEGENLDELQTNLKTKKIIGTDAEGGVEVHTVDIPYQARKEKLEIDEKNIYRFGMGFNSSQSGDGNITNVVIRSRYTLLELKAGKLEKRVKKLLKKLVKIVLDEINKNNGTDYQMKDVYFDFTHEVMTNESENYANEKVKAETQGVVINNILNAAAKLDDVTVAKAICDAFDIDYEEIKDKLPEPVENLEKLQGVIDSAAIDDVEEPTEGE